MLAKWNWLGKGDLGAFFVIAFDNLTAITFISTILNFGFGFPLDIILHNVIPGCTASIIFGNILFIILYRYKAREYGPTTMAMPNGIDTPSALAFVTLLVGPAFLVAKKNGMDINDAALLAWHISAAAMILVGVIKVIFSFFTNFLHRIIPSAALFSAIGGIGLAIITFFPIVSAFSLPIIGFPVLTILMIAFYARKNMPFNFSPIPFAIIIGVLVYYLAMYFGVVNKQYLSADSLTIHFMLPILNNLMPYMGQALLYFAIVLPFALLVIFGAITVVESANKFEQEQYGVRSVILIDGIATILGGICGSVIQTTPYAGFVAYKKMDARAGFLVMNMIIIAIGGFSGLFGVFMAVVPTAAIAPVLIFVGFEISHQGFHVVDLKYALAILFGFIPAIAKLLIIKISTLPLIATGTLEPFIFKDLSHRVNDYFLINVLASGSFVTAILWASFFCFIIDRQKNRAAICAVVMAIFSFFGLIHSVYLDEAIYLPWTLAPDLSKYVYMLSLGYILTALVSWVLLHRKDPTDAITVS